MDKETAILLLCGGGGLLLAGGALALERLSPNRNVTRWDDYIYLAASQTQVPAAMIAAVIEIESGGHDKAQGTAGERGLMQIKCATARQVGYSGECPQLFDPRLNILSGAKYLRWQLNRYAGDMARAFSAYNAGTASESNILYVRKALAAYYRYSIYYD